MQQGKRLKVDLEELCYALDDSSHEHSYYLDLQTGELLFISDYMDTEEAEKLKKQIDDDPDRYESLPKADFLRRLSRHGGLHRHGGGRTPCAPT